MSVLNGLDDLTPLVTSAGKAFLGKWQETNAERNRLIEEKLMWMNVSPFDSYRWLAEYIIDLELENRRLKK